MSTDTITVACKLPHGLILRLFEMVPHSEALVSGTFKEVLRAQPTGEPVLINGYLAKYDPSLPPVAQGSRFAVTHNVSKDFFEEWLDQNKDLDLVRNGLIFAHAEAASLKAEAREKEKLKNGLEPIDPSNMPKNFQKVKTYAKNDAAAG